MDATKWAYLCTLSYFGLLILTPTVSSQKYSSIHKDYFLSRESKTFDEAVDLCKSRGERLVEIKSPAEQEFVWKKISITAGYYIWLGATNTPGTNNFTWLADGSDVTTHYTNWRDSRPNGDVKQRNGICLFNADGKWGDWLVSTRLYVLCERDSVLTVQSQLIEHTEQSNAKIEQLESQLKVTVASSSTQRKEYLQLIWEVKQDYNRVHNQLIEHTQVNYNPNDSIMKQKDINKKLESQVNDIATEIEFQNKHSSQLISKLNAEVASLKKDFLTCNNAQRVEMLIQQNDFLEKRLNRLEQKMSNSIVDNSNKIE